MDLCQVVEQRDRRTCLRKTYNWCCGLPGLFTTSLEVFVRFRTVISSLIGLALVLAMAAPAAAQGAAASSAGPTFAAGVSFLNIADDTGKGFQVDLSYPVSSMDKGSIGVVGDFAWHTYGDDVSSLMFGGGVRFTATGNDKFQPFGQVLVGAFRIAFGDFSQTEMYIAPGGGVDVKLNDKWNFRGQLDIPIVMFSEEDGGSETGVRFMFGVSTRIGG